MSGGSITIRAVGFGDVASTFDRLARGEWRHGLMAIVGQLVEAQVRRRVASEKSAPSGARWAAWAPSTAARRSGAHSLLVYTGKLLSSFFNRSSDVTAEVGTPVPYADFLNDGTKFMPQREFFGLSEQNKSEVSRAVDSFIQSRIFA